MQPARLRARLRAVLLVGVVALFVLSVPWYRAATPAGEEPARWLGLPDWVAVALLCYAAAALLNGAAWLLTDIEEGSDEGGEG